MVKEQEKAEKERYAVIEIATQTSPVLYDSETEQQLDVMQALKQILNTLEKLKGLL